MREKGVVDGGREKRGSNEARLENEPMSDVGWIVSESDGLREWTILCSRIARNLKYCNLVTRGYPCHGYGFGTGSESATLTRTRVTRTRDPSRVWPTRGNP
ncbi:hypothetical protein EDB84DRAFT_1441891 [Lactarius hengduanensis]|nr:hypothetical protein EDB84DRAFT_1441891 [Lactarius hengduanensis]